MANNANDVLSMARGEIGYNRWNDPEQGTKYGRWFSQDHGSYYGTSGVPFCAMFVSWVFNQAGASCAGLPEAYCPYIKNKANSAGAVVSKTSAQPGDVVIFQWDSGAVDHVGIVEKNCGSYIQTIEGNTTINGISGSVGRRTRSWGVVDTAIRPSWGAATVPTAGIDLGDTSIWGRKFNKAIQEQFGTTQDGVMSGQYHGNDTYFWAKDPDAVTYENDGISEMVRALQRKIQATGHSVGSSGIDGADARKLGLLSRPIRLRRIQWARHQPRGCAGNRRRQISLALCGSHTGA